QENVNVLGIAYRDLINPRDPGRDRMAAADRIGDPIGVQCGRGPGKPLSHLLHGADHALQRNRFQRRSHRVPPDAVIVPMPPSKPETRPSATLFVLRPWTGFVTVG